MHTFPIVYVLISNELEWTKHGMEISRGKMAMFEYVKISNDINLTGNVSMICINMHTISQLLKVLT